jgi:hypothetical protein
MYKKILHITSGFYTGPSSQLYSPMRRICRHAAKSNRHYIVNRCSFLDNVDSYDPRHLISECDKAQEKMKADMKQTYAKDDQPLLTMPAIGRPATELKAALEHKVSRAVAPPTPPVVHDAILNLKQLYKRMSPVSFVPGSLLCMSLAREFRCTLNQGE